MNKKTKYFASQFYNYSNIDSAITEAEEKRDEFIGNNKNLISEISFESIQSLSISNGQSISLLITLSYYTHE